MRWLPAAATSAGLAVLAACTDPVPASPGDAAIDAAIDADDPCLRCGPEQICVAEYDGTCLGGAVCVTRTIDCPDNTCSSACEAAYCEPPYQCQVRPPCGGEPPGAFTCYGP